MMGGGECGRDLFLARGWGGREWVCGVGKDV